MRTLILANDRYIAILCIKIGKYIFNIQVGSKTLK